jgi:HAD superfamily hydrolase (TIGR01509 family)
MPEETLFIDDTLANVEAAHELGLVTVHLTHPHQLFEILQ